MSTDNAEYLNARERAMEKIRKLLAMGTDGRGNLTEAETAMRQAQALMRKWQIESADEVLADLKAGKDMIQDHDSPFAYPSSNAPKKVPAWVGVCGVSAGMLCTVKVDIVGHHELGVRVRFSGYGPDVQFAKWLYRYLIETIHQMAVEAYSSRGEREAYRYQCAGTVQTRIKEMVAKQKAQDEASARGNFEAIEGTGVGTALAIFDAKLAAVNAAFGEQQVTTQKREMTDAGYRGYQDGQKLNIPTARPLGGETGEQHGRLE